MSEPVPGACRRAFRHPEIRTLMGHFLDRLDQHPFGERAQRVVVPVKGRFLKSLHGAGRPGDDRNLWRLIGDLAEAGVISIGHRRKRRGDDEPWHHAEIELLPEGEAAVREALDRPFLTPWSVEWRAAVDAARGAFADPEFAAAQPLPRIHGLSAEAMVQRLGGLPGLLSRRRLSAYQLGALLFGADSKTLADREEWLERAFGLNADDHLIRRPLLVEVHLPQAEILGALLIENMDSYLEACSGAWPHTQGLALVYNAGFRGTAGRIRRPEHVLLHASVDGSLDADDLARFRQAWFSEDDPPWPIHFFGDLDWAGLRMFAGLRRAFPGVLPWRPGYEALLEARSRGLAHAPQDAGRKANQVAIAETGDAWLDEIAARLAEDPRFVDQEVASEFLERPASRF